MSENVMEFYETLGFEEIDIEDGYTAFFYEVDNEGTYALITDEDGALPKSLKQRIIFACYNSEDAYIWSASFKNSYILQEIWSKSEAINDKLNAIQKHRKDNEI